MPMKTKRQLRAKRRLRVRAKISGTSSRPRLVVFRSNRALSVQVIDDVRGVTLLSQYQRGKNKEAAKTLGEEVARAAKAKGIQAIVFDRDGYRYHGVIRELATALRASGLQF